jgi:hypothetical protein
MAEFGRGGAPHIEDKPGREAYKVWLQSEINKRGGRVNKMAGIKKLQAQLSELKAKD